MSAPEKSNQPIRRPSRGVLSRVSTVPVCRRRHGYHCRVRGIGVGTPGVAYAPIIIRLSSLMAQIPGLEELSKITAEDDRIRESMKAGNEIRRIIGQADAVVRLALSTINDTRKHCSGGDITVPAERHCFIISSRSAKKSLRSSDAFRSTHFIGLRVRTKRSAN